jgi:NADPH:quinone reductase-like Zn-dependent oxidoreductase
MRAIVQDRYGSADVLALGEVDRPSIRGEDVLVRVRAAGVDAGVWILTAGRPLLMRAFAGPRRPRAAVRGHELAGVVEVVGGRVSGFQPGDEVYGTCRSGSYAEYAAAPQRQLAAKPANLSFEQAAVVPVSGTTALQAVRAAHVRPGQRVMIIGAGGVGSFAIQIAKASGASVTAVCSPAKVDLVRSIGAEDVIDYTREEIDRDGPRYDAIVDTAGNRPLSLLRRALAPHGILALVGSGLYRGIFGGYGRQLVRAPLVSLFVGQRLVNVVARTTAEGLDELRELIESGKVTPVIDRTFPLAEVPEAVRYFAHGHTAGKIAVTL